MKIAVVGGGSTYTPELVDGVARLTGALKITELALVDPDESRLAAVGPVSARIMSAYGHPARVSWTTRPGWRARRGRRWSCSSSGSAARPPGSGTRPGRWSAAASARRPPARAAWPRRCGRCRSCWTSPSGPGSAADPGAWIIDFTNPVGIVTRALLDAGHRAVGLCNVAIGFQRLFARLLGTEPDQVQLDHVGLNHLTWERAVLVDGTDRLPELIAAHGEEIASHTGLPASVLHDVGAVPSYYLRYFWAHDAVVAEERTRPTRAEEVAAIEQELLAMYADPDLDHKPALLSERGGAFYSEAAVALLASLVGDTGDTQVVNVRNAGTFPFLDADAVIEVPAVIGADGPRPVLAAPLPPLMRGLVAHVSAYEELAVDAALHGGRDRVRTALLAHPLVGQLDLADGLTDRLLAENRAFLPWTHE